MTEFERFGLSGKKKLREAETLTRQIKRIVLHFSPILFIQYKYRHNSFVSIFLFYINKVNPIPFGWFNSRIILLLSGNISSCYSLNDHLKRIYKRCFTLHNKYVHTQVLRMINISLSRNYNVHIEMSELI